MFLYPAAQEVLGTLPPAERDELIILIGNAAGDTWHPGEEGRAP